MGREVDSVGTVLLPAFMAKAKRATNMNTTLRMDTAPVAMAPFNRPFILRRGSGCPYCSLAAPQCSQYWAVWGMGCWQLWQGSRVCLRPKAR